MSVRAAVGAKYQRVVFNRFERMDRRRVEIQHPVLILVFQFAPFEWKYL